MKLTNPESNEIKTVGRSFFRLLRHHVFQNLYFMDLSSTVFSLADFEFSACSFPLIKEMTIEKCTIFISRRQTLEPENDRILRRVLVDYVKKRSSLKQGIKVFLVTLAQSLETLETVNTGGTEFQSTGCIVYSYGTEQEGAGYKLLLEEEIRPSISCFKWISL